MGTLRPKNGSFNENQRKLIKGFNNRGGGNVCEDENSVLSNQKGGLMTRWEGPIRENYTFQLGSEHGGEKL